MKSWCNIVGDYCCVDVSKSFSERGKTKKITCLKYQDLCCFIFFVEYLRLWKSMEMNNRHNVWGKFFVLVGRNSYCIFNWFNRSPSELLLVPSCPQTSKTKNREIQLLLLRFTVHQTVTFPLCG